MCTPLADIRVSLQLFNQHVLVEHVHAHRRPGPARVRWLLLEVRHPAVSVQVQHAEAVGLLTRQLVHSNRRISRLAPVVGNHVPVRGQIDVVPARISTSRARDSSITYRFW